MRAAARRMKKFLRWFLGSLLVLLLLAVAALLGRDVILKQLAERSLERSTGWRAEIGSLHTGLGSTSLHLQQVLLYNRADFGGGLLLDVPEVFAELDRAELFAGRLNFKRLRLHFAELNIVRDRQGRFNLDQIGREVVEASPRIPGPATKASFTFAGIDHLTLSLGSVNYTDLQKPSRSRRMEIGLKDEVATRLKTGEDFQEWFGSLLFRVILEQSLKTTGDGKPKRFELLFDQEPAEGTNATAEPK